MQRQLAAMAGAFLRRARGATLAEVQAAAWAFQNITDEPGGLETLQRLCSR
jgi:hypothetical protein